MPYDEGAMGGELRIGMIGAGMVGQLAHLANFVQIPGCRVTALAELRPGLGKLAAERFGVPRLFASHRDLLAADAADAVVVVTRRPATGPIVLEALEAGRHVLSEKPMAHTGTQARRLAEVADARGLVYAVGFMKRHDAGTALAKRHLDAFIASGELGRILMLRVWSHGGEFACGADGYVMTDEVRPEGIDLWPMAPDWMPTERHSDYAWFLNVFVHDLNLLRYFAGSPLVVRAADLNRPNGRLVLFDCGDFPAVLEMAEQTGTAWHEGVEAVFERGRMQLTFCSPMEKNQPAAVTITRGREVTRLVPDWSWSFRRQAEAFVADVVGNHAPIASGADSIHDLALAEEIWQRHLGCA
jgi:predicted dehydrogenase